LTARKLVGR